MKNNTIKKLTALLLAKQAPHRTQTKRTKRRTSQRSPTRNPPPKRTGVPGSPRLSRRLMSASASWS